MPKEIERKFLVRDDVLLPAGKEELMVQGYLPTKDGVTVRVRVTNKKAYLTIKGPTKGITRDEYEYTIPMPEAEELLKRYCWKSLVKVRRRISIGKHVWEVDTFKGDNAGLVTAEVELSSGKEKVKIPSWIGKEVTGHSKYSSAHLAENPYRTWDDAS